MKQYEQQTYAAHPRLLIARLAVSAVFWAVVLLVIGAMAVFALTSKPDKTQRCIDSAQTEAGIDRCMEKGGYR